MTGVTVIVAGVVVLVGEVIVMVGEAREVVEDDAGDTAPVAAGVVAVVTVVVVIAGVVVAPEVVVAVVGDAGAGVSLDAPIFKEGIALAPVSPLVVALVLVNPGEEVEGVILAVDDSVEGTVSAVAFVESVEMASVDDDVTIVSPFSSVVAGLTVVVDTAEAVTGTAAGVVVTVVVVVEGMMTGSTGHSGLSQTDSPV